jgi:O-antigen/teichoic acid export membrane protein
LGVLTFVAPLLTIQFNPSVAWATTALLASRILALVAYYLAASRERGELRTPCKPARSQVRPLLKFGGWLTVTNIVGPLMPYLDRFFVGAILGLTAVAYYVTPYEVLSRLQILPRAIMGVLFPAMAAAHGEGKNRLIDIYAHGSKVIFWFMLPITGGVFLLAPEALQIWLGTEFRLEATPVMHWLAAGWMINTLARPAFTALQTAGRPDLVAKAHLAELAPYLLLLWWLSTLYGISGAAAAWTLRTLADTLILNTLAAAQLPMLRVQVLRTFSVVGGACLGFLALWLLEPLILRVVVLLVVSCLAIAVRSPVISKVFDKKLSKLHG